MKKMNFSYSSQPILTVSNNIKKKNIILNPDFQRGYIWKREFKDELIVSILSNYPIGNIILSQTKAANDVVDGQQRLTTIYDFIGYGKETHGIKNKQSVEKIKDIIKIYYKRMENNLTDNEKQTFSNVLTKKSIYYKDLPEVIKDDIMSYNLNITTITGSTEETVVEYFKYVQNQEALKAGEIINSMHLYNRDLSSLVSEIRKIDIFIEGLNISNKRNEFTKHLVNFFGVLNNKLRLNTSSTNIVNYANKFTNEEKNEYIELLLDNINTISDYLENNKIKMKRRLTTRSLKILLSYSSFYLISYEKVPKIFEAIEKVEGSIKDKSDKYESITFIQVKSRGYEDIRESAMQFNSLISGDFVWVKTF